MSNGQLALLFDLIGIAWLLTYSTLLGAIGDALGRPGPRRAMRWLSGTVTGRPTVELVRVIPDRASTTWSKPVRYWSGRHLLLDKGASLCSTRDRNGFGRQLASATSGPHAVTATLRATGSTADRRSSGALQKLLVGLCHCGDRRHAGRKGCQCIDVRDTPIDRPDLAIYSQLEQIAAGALPSWDSPDIVTNDWGPFRLRPEASVKVRNLSATTSAINARVHYYTSPFGIGTRRQLRLTRVISLGASQETELLFPLTQELLSGDPRTGVHIVIEHPTDDRLINNAGSQVHDGGYTTESGRSFAVQIPVLNDSGVPQRIDLAVLPTDLVATVTPSSHNFGAFEQIVATLRIDVPAFLVGSPATQIARAVTVIGRRAGGELVGGITRLLRIDS